MPLKDKKGFQWSVRCYKCRMKIWRYVDEPKLKISVELKSVIAMFKHAACLKSLTFNNTAIQEGWLRFG